MKFNFTSKKFFVFSFFLSLLFVSTSVFSQKTLNDYFEGLQSSYDQKKYDSMLYYAKILDTIRPNHPTVLRYLSLSYSLNKDSKQTEKTLQKLALIYAEPSVLENEELISSLKKSQLKRLQKLWNTQNEKVQISTQAFLLPARHIEGLTSLGENKIAFACINKPAIGFWDGKDTSYMEMKMPVMNLFYEEATQKLWGVMSELENSSLYKEENKGKAAIFCIDTKTNKKIVEYELSDSLDHVLGEIKQAKDGTIYCTDSQNPIIYVWNEQTQKLEEKWTNPKWRSLQGITFSEDGKWAFVADYSSTIYQINIQTGKINALEAPKGFSFKTTDGLYLYKNTLITVQNGTSPMRVSSFELDMQNQKAKTGKILEQQNIYFGEPTNGFLIGNKFYYIANSQWGNYDKENKPKNDWKPVVVLMIEIE
ncbi:hypothetical protein V9L05_10785 [Bernardetia sp. Wsw4-3y2]|uniref:hypothetical protein n=1 Tax=Bernardetia sp. Wsw4-3y2 TaxID=3127471 RepID=UPI0030CD584B